MSIGLLPSEHQRVQPRLNYTISFPGHLQYTAPAAPGNDSSPPIVAFAQRTLRTIATNPFVTSTLPKLALRISLGIAVGLVCFPVNVAITIAVIQGIVHAIGIAKFGAIQNESPSYGGRFPSAFSACIIAPILEEVFFRGILQPAIKTMIKCIASLFFLKETAKKIATVTATIFSSVLFGAAHFINSANPLVALPQVVMAIFSGIILGIEKETSGGLLQPVVHHMTHNTLSWLLAKIASGACILS